MATPCFSALSSEAGRSTYGSNLPEVQPAQVAIGLPIGEGAFCRVYEGQWTGCYSAYSRHMGTYGAVNPLGQSPSVPPGAQVDAISVAVKVLKSPRGCPASALYTAGQRLVCEGQLLWNLQHRYCVGASASTEKGIQAIYQSLVQLVDSIINDLDTCHPSAFKT